MSKLNLEVVKEFGYTKIYTDIAGKRTLLINTPYALNEEALNKFKSFALSYAKELCKENN